MSETQLVHELKAKHAEQVKDDLQAVAKIEAELRDDESNKGLSEEDITEKS